MQPWTAGQNVRLDPSGTILMVRAPGRSADMMVAGIRASELARSIDKGGAADRGGRIGDDAAISMNHGQARMAGRWRSDQRQFDRGKNDPRAAIPGKRCLAR